MFTIGVWKDANIEQINKISYHLYVLEKGQKSIFDEAKNKHDENYTQGQELQAMPSDRFADIGR